MTAFRWFGGVDPLREMARLQREINDLFDSPRRYLRGLRSEDFPPVALALDGDDVLVSVECPGLSLADFDVSVTGDTLTVRGERKPADEVGERAWHRRERFAGKFARSIQLPQRVNADKAEAHYVNGVLGIRIPRSEDSKPKRIAIASD